MLPQLSICVFVCRYCANLHIFRLRFLVYTTVCSVLMGFRTNSPADRRRAQILGRVHEHRPTEMLSPRLHLQRHLSPKGKHSKGCLTQPLLQYSHDIKGIDKDVNVHCWPGHRSYSQLQTFSIDQLTTDLTNIMFHTKAEEMFLYSYFI